MTGNGTDEAGDRLALRSRLSDIARLRPWIEGLASRHAIPENVQFAINVCLEEALANAIRHGYGGAPDRPLIVHFTTPSAGYFVFAVDDEAPRFNPLDAPELPPLSPREEIRIGGQGLRLLRRFADSLEYEPTPAGNRLRIGFCAAVPAVRPK
jgi:serine/threonine-protein kinase RsbW